MAVLAVDPPLSLRAYRAVGRLASPLVEQVLKTRARRGKEDPLRLGERLGRPSAARPGGPLLWMHGVSVGESVSLLPLLDVLLAERPDIAALVTSGTRASAEVMARRLPPRAVHQYAPVDTPAAVARFLTFWRPQLGIFAESELWPNLILGAAARGARLALVSARMTERSARAWSARPAAVGALLKRFDLILAQDDATRARLEALGGRVDGLLNLKRAGAPLAADEAEVRRLRSEIGERPVIAGVSTHPSEERVLAVAAARAGADVLALIAPRRPERGAEVARELRALFGPGAVAVRSAGEPIGDARVYLFDTLNEIGLVLRLAQVAFVGKSLGPEAGGHNPLEPARLGVGVVSGPHVANFADIYREMESEGAALIVPYPDALAGAFARLLRNAAALTSLRQAARAFADRQGDQLSGALATIRPLLPAV